MLAVRGGINVAKAAIKTTNLFCAFENTENGLSDCGLPWFSCCTPSSPFSVSSTSDNIITLVSGCQGETIFLTLLIDSDLEISSCLNVVGFSSSDMFLPKVSRVNSSKESSKESSD